MVKRYFLSACAFSVLATASAASAQTAQTMPPPGQTTASGQEQATDSPSGALDGQPAGADATTSTGDG